MAEVSINAEIFGAFKCWSGWVPSGYWSSWLGVLTPAHVWAFPPEIAAIYSKGRYETFAYPTSDEHVLDWAPLLEAALCSKGPFVMVAVGAGWGRWLSAGAFAAMQQGKSYRLVGVEAEPQHFQWMESHLRENNIDPACCRLINAAASNHNGVCWFYIGNPAAWYGQAVVPDEAVSLPQPGPVEIGYETAYGSEKIRRIRCVDLQEVTRHLPCIDYMHMDIQGAEYDFLTAHPHLLDSTVKMVNVGTHSEEIEDGLRNFFAGLGWRNRYDVPLGAQLEVHLGDKPCGVVSFGDGVQVWLNPKLRSDQKDAV